MTWEDTIKFIRTRSEFRDLVEKTYLDENLNLNVERFQRSDEFSETLKLMEKYSNGGKRVLDMGSGNGVSAVAFALIGFDVTAVEPDPSITVGAGAIRKLKEHYKLENLEVQETFAEELQLKSDSFDLVYVRQCMHHAHNLEKFLAEISRVLRPAGFLLTIRDHVVFDVQDKKWFLESHPLQKYYGGENAFSPDEYKAAMEKAGLTVKQELKYFESVINYFPFTKDEIQNFPAKAEKDLHEALKKKVGFLADIPIVFSLFKRRHGVKSGEYNERLIPGRMYTYIAQKEK